MVERLVAELSRRGFRVATVKHAHHDAEIDNPGTDSYRHREAGATGVALVTSRRWAVMHELRDEAEPTLSGILSRLSPADLVIVEGFKREPIPTIEVRRPDDPETLAADDPSILAVAADHRCETYGRPPFQRDDIGVIGDLLVSEFGLARRDRRPSVT